MSRTLKVLLVGSCGKLAGRLAVLREGGVEVRSAETDCSFFLPGRLKLLVHRSRQDADALARFVDRWGTLR